jgi:hypothetical protein
MKLTTRLHLVPRLRKRGVIPLLLHTSSWRGDWFSNSMQWLWAVTWKRRGRKGSWKTLAQCFPGRNEENHEEHRSGYPRSPEYEGDLITSTQDVAYLKLWSEVSFREMGDTWKSSNQETSGSHAMHRRKEREISWVTQRRCIDCSRYLASNDLFR